MIITREIQNMNLGNERIKMSRTQGIRIKVKDTRRWKNHLQLIRMRIKGLLNIKIWWLEPCLTISNLETALNHLEISLKIEAIYIRISLLKESVHLVERKASVNFYKTTTKPKRKNSTMIIKSLLRHQFHQRHNKISHLFQDLISATKTIKKNWNGN